MTKKDKLTIVPEQAKGRWYHLFVEGDTDNHYAKVIYQHSDDVFYDIETDPDSVNGKVKPNHIGVHGGFGDVTLPDAPSPQMSVSFYTSDNVEQNGNNFFVPTYKVVDGKYVKQDTGVVITYMPVSSDNGMELIAVPQTSSKRLYAVKFATNNFSISNVVATDIQTEDSSAGGIATTSYVMSEYNDKAYNVYITPNVTSLNLWIYGAFTE